MSHFLSKSALGLLICASYTKARSAEDQPLLSNRFGNIWWTDHAISCHALERRNCFAMQLYRFILKPTWLDGGENKPTSQYTLSRLSCFSFWTLGCCHCCYARLYCCKLSLLSKVVQHWRNIVGRRLFFVRWAFTLSKLTAAHILRCVNSAGTDYILIQKSGILKESLFCGGQYGTLSWMDWSWVVLMLDYVIPVKIMNVNTTIHWIW